MFENNYISGLVKANKTEKKQARKSWSIDLESVWLPFFNATNATGETAISNEALGVPLRLSTDKDGMVKFAKDGKPRITIVKELSDTIKCVRENFVAGLQSYAHDVASSDDTKQAYNDQIEANLRASKPIVKAEQKKLKEAIKMLEQSEIEEALKHADTIEAKNATPELVNA
jgi:hypothetical protein